MLWSHGLDFRHGQFSLATVEAHETMILWMSAIMFIAMVLIQVFAMPYVMAETPADVFFSLTQVYMGAFMGAAMVLAMGVTHTLPWWLWILAAAVAAAAVFAYRRQLFVTDRQYLRDMIPHHSMALVTSAPRLTSSDPIVQRLAEQITASQRREIAEMKHRLRSVS